MPHESVSICIGENCVELASVSRPPGGKVNPPTHREAFPEFRCNLELAAILTAANPTVEARMAGLAFVAHELGRLAVSMQTLDAKQSASLIESSGKIVMAIHNLAFKLSG